MLLLLLLLLHPRQWRPGGLRCRHFLLVLQYSVLLITAATAAAAAAVAHLTASACSVSTPL